MESLTRRDFVNVMVGTTTAFSMARSTAMSLALGASGSSEPKAILEPFNYSGVHISGGMLKEQYDAARDYYYRIPDDDILRVFRKRARLSAPGRDLGGWYDDSRWPWPGHSFGQWLSGMARLFPATGDVPMGEKATRLMLEWAKAIDSDGTSYPWPIMNRSNYVWDKMACGLVDMFEYGGQEAALPLLGRITDWAIRTLDRSRKPASLSLPMGEPEDWYTLGENLYLAYLLTGNSRYRDFGDVWRYPTFWNMLARNSEPVLEGLRGYDHVNTLSSAIMTYVVTGDPQYLKAAANGFDYYEKTQFYATGNYGPGELFVAPDGSLGRFVELEPLASGVPWTVGRSGDTCCDTWAGFKMGRYLIMYTGEAKYGDWIEKLAYDVIGAAFPITDQGRTFYYADYRLGGGTKVYLPDTWPCCSGTYIQDMAEYHNLIYFKDSSGLYVNLFVPSEVTWNYQGEVVRVLQETNYPETDTTTLTVHANKNLAFTLGFRVPRWTRGASLKLNAVPINTPIRPGTWAKIQRSWNPGDQVTIQLPMQLALAPIDKQHPRRVAVVYGPVVLVRVKEKISPSSLEDPSKWVAHTAKLLEFQATGHSAATLLPFYRVGYDTPYRMYFDLER